MKIYKRHAIKDKDTRKPLEEVFHEGRAIIGPLCDATNFDLKKDGYDAYLALPLLANITLISEEEYNKYVTDARQSTVDAVDGARNEYFRGLGDYRLQKSAILTKLGLTEDELRLLLTYGP